MKKYWKTLFGTCIYQSIDGAKVHQNIAYRWLTLNNDVIQTLINRCQPSRCSLRYIKSLTFALRHLPADACLLGLGGAAVAHTFNNNNHKLTAIECNPNVIQIAQEYFMSDKLKNLVIIQQDADLFVKNCQNKYQHLIIDIHDTFGFPNSCNSSEFFYNCKNILLPNGILAINLANINDYAPIIKLLNEQFSKNRICIPIDKTENMVIYVSKNDSINNLLYLFKQSHEVKKLIWDSRWGYVAKL